ncbi:MAG: histidinol dehydrogenase, partial [Prevotella sp.]|nr:histidinol dehydrogenase [Prevotella sp.]
MNIIKYPLRSEWASIVERPHLDVSQLNATVANILEDIKAHGDEAVKRFEEQFDHVSLDDLAVSKYEVDEAMTLVSDELKTSLELAHQNILKFHDAQIFEPRKIETAKGVTCWQKSVAIQKVGLYIPGGTAPLFSTVLMLATPAKIAGCKEIVLCTPPNKDGKVNPAILAAARIA